MDWKSECSEYGNVIGKSQKSIPTNLSEGDLGNQQATISKPKQYNFARHWKSKIVPLLDNPCVARALTFGLKLYDIDCCDGDPPWLCGRGQWNGQRARKGCLSWYQPWGRCHNTAPFCWALGQNLYPDQKWGVVSGEYHTVVIGWSDTWEQPEWVMDILLFREKSAQESLDFVKQREWKFYSSLSQYAASFFKGTEAVHAGVAEETGDEHASIDLRNHV